MKKVLITLMFSFVALAAFSQTSDTTKTKALEDSYVTAADAAPANSTLLPGEALPPSDPIYHKYERKERRKGNTGRVLGNVLLTGLIVTTYVLR